MRWVSNVNKMSKSTSYPLAAWVQLGTAIGPPQSCGHSRCGGIHHSEQTQHIQGTKTHCIDHFFLVQVPTAVGAGGGISDQATPLYPERRQERNAEVSQVVDG